MFLEENVENAIRFSLALFEKEGDVQDQIKQLFIDGQSLHN
jgi:hypothetical protein